MKSYINLFPFLLICIAGCSTTQQPSSLPTHTSTTVTKAKNQIISLKEVKQNNKNIGDSVVKTAESLLGTPYKYGGTDPRGFDCSGLVYYSYLQSGIEIPRTTRQQANNTTPIDWQKLRPGDLLFFQTFGNDISHVGIYTGNDQFIHAPKSGKQVTHQQVDTYWKNRLIKTGRPH